jgi:hypothetical protein
MPAPGILIDGGRPATTYAALKATTSCQPGQRIPSGGAGGDRLTGDQGQDVLSGDDGLTLAA